MSRLGETAEPSPSAIPGPADVIALKAESLLPGVGAKLLREASAAMLGDGAPVEATVTMRRMPCGLYAAEVAWPEDFVRLASVKMAGWERSLEPIIYIGDVGWGCQWSEEAGIAGCPSRPKGYVVASSAGRILRLMGSETSADELEWLRWWRIPRGDSFEFPAALYPTLVSEISRNL